MENLTIGNIIGQGSYGTVYNGLYNNKPVAIKSFPLQKAQPISIWGNQMRIPHLFECSIMSSFRHPTLNPSISILTHQNHLYIIQELAISDLYRWRQNNQPEMEDLLRWSSSLNTAINLLHRYSVVHGDIKLTNILLYNDKSVKLTDFTFSRLLKGSKTLGSRETPYTITHRSLEVLLNRPISLEDDLWAFGCTLFQLRYNYLLFPFQLNIAAYNNSILEWYQKNFDFDSTSKLGFRDTAYQSANVPPSWTPSLLNSNEVDVYDKIIINLLRPIGKRERSSTTIGKYSILSPKNIKLRGSDWSDQIPNYLFDHTEKIFKNIPDSVRWTACVELSKSLMDLPSQGLDGPRDPSLINIELLITSFFEFRLIPFTLI